MESRPPTDWNPSRGGAREIARFSIGTLRNPAIANTLGSKITTLRQWLSRYSRVTIYTARQLLQLFERVYGLRAVKERMWIDGDGVYDPFRPKVEPTPFASVQEFEQSQRSHFAAVRNVFEKSDVFVFTFGLTEGWENIEDECVYPLCPGTAAGTFDANRYRFRNFDYSEVYGDFQRFRQLAREINPKLRFLLTVSPVPLVATATDQHILAATIYSKSVLRAVAGKLAAEDHLTDYFPSYEVIASHPMQGRFFEQNMRSVAPEGVNYVMTHYFAEHGQQALPQVKQEVPQTVAKVEKAPADPSDVICEEMFLEQTSCK